MLPYKKRALYNIELQKQKEINVKEESEEESYDQEMTEEMDMGEEGEDDEDDEDDGGINIEKTFKTIFENYQFKEIIDDVINHIKNSYKGKIIIKKEELIKEYIRFMILKAYYKDHDSRLYQPSFGIEIFWQIHCLKETEYKHFCEYYLNNIFIRPNPDSLFDKKKKKKKYLDTLNIYHQTFGNDINEKIWPSSFNGY